ncbi:MAG TPA: hypothetical protein VN772_01115 [Solirubrobacteraceae bacterium]|nr:hypothetical protein [Solirubrobacteraceae bacterium]
MSRSLIPHRLGWLRPAVAGLLALALAALVLSPPAVASGDAPAAAGATGATAQLSRVKAHAIGKPRTPGMRARRLLASRSWALRRCLRRHRAHPARCWAVRRAVRRAAHWLAYLTRGVTPVQPAAAPASSPAAPTERPSPASVASAAGGFEMGAVGGSAWLYELPWLEQLGAHTARLEFEIGSPVSQLAPVVEAYARAGIRPLLLAGFTGRVPSTAEAQNLATWAAAFGPGGSFWRGKTFPPGTAVTDIEFGNETNNPYQYGSQSETWWEEPAFILRAEEYARRLRDAQEAIARAEPGVGLLAIGDEYGGHTTWDEAMFRAVPDLGQRVAGWTVHPYGPKWWTEIDNEIANTQAHGAPSNIPIYVTEWGVSSDNGRCLSDNYGWNPCMTYQEAAEALSSTVAAMHSRYGSRLRALYVYQASDLRPSGASSDRENYFGALQSDRAPKGAYTVEVQSLLATYP